MEVLSALQLSVRQLSFWRGERCLFEALDFDLHAQQLALVIGANGAGKTTLLRVLAGLAMPTSGSVSWRGGSIASLPPEQRADIAYRGHLDGLKKELTVTENLEFHRAFWASSVALEPLLAELQLTHAAHTRVRQLSAGQRRRAGLAALQVSAAQLWILDEPMTNLDREGLDLMVAWTRRHLLAGGAAVIATHQPDEFMSPGTLLIEL